MAYLLFAHMLFLLLATGSHVQPVHGGKVTSPALPPRRSEIVSEVLDLWMEASRTPGFICWMTENKLVWIVKSALCKLAC